MLKLLLLLLYPCLNFSPFSVFFVLVYIQKDETTRKIHANERVQQQKRKNFVQISSPFLLFFLYLACIRAFVGVGRWLATFMYASCENFAGFQLGWKSFDSDSETE